MWLHLWSVVEDTKATATKCVPMIRQLSIKQVDPPNRGAGQIATYALIHTPLLDSVMNESVF